MGYGEDDVPVTDAMTAAALRHAEDYERRLLRPGQRDIVSPLAVKRRMKPKIELKTKAREKAEKERVERDKAGGGAGSSSGGVGEGGVALAAAANAAKNLPRFGFAGIIESKPMERIAEQLHKNATRMDRMKCMGLPTALAVSSRFIAVGTQRGVVMVFDLFEELRQQLGLRLTDGGAVLGGGSDVLSDKCGSVTSIDLSSSGDTLIAGYTSGMVALWDVIQGKVLKSVTEAHPSPITSARYISDKDRISVVTVDAGGLVNKLTFGKVLLFSTYTVETECLLDGTAGQILAMHVLPPLSTATLPPTAPGADLHDAYSSYHPSIKRLVLIALSSDRSSFAVAVEPSVNVLHRWAKPPVEQMNVDAFVTTGSKVPTEKGGNDSSGDAETARVPSAPHAFLPCLSWGWSFVSGGGHTVTPILARAWGCSLQMLRTNFPPHDPNDGPVDQSLMHWPAFGVQDEFEASAPVVALEWLGVRSLAYLTVTNEFCMVDTVRSAGCIGGFF